ncbi:MAG: fibronectin type III domain-containing protein, partial [Bacteroidales bacterium]|nr:fibronectin type III domain-containing protein [Bacteroidales bacterium]
MRKLFLSLVAILLCSVTSFAQTEIWTAQGFIDSVGTSGDYKLMSDINLGIFEDDLIKSSTFSGTFDGNGHTITYQASYSSGSFGLFQSVSGTIKNLTVDASVTFGGSSNHLNVGLLCGSLGSSGLLQNCNVIGVINSTAVSNNGAGSDSGLLVGESSGTIKYCIGNGSVTGLGHVGGLIGRMNGGSVLGSAFTGSLYAIAPDKANGDHSYGSVAGGICGAVQAGSSIKSCFVKADIVAEDANKNKVPCLPYGIAYDHNDVNIDVLNNYCEGTLNGEPIDAHADVTDSGDTGNNSNYYPGYGNMSNQAIVDALNNAANNDPNIHFGLTDDGDGDDEEVIFGVVSTTKVCETPTNLTITNNAGTFTASWTSANANNTITESHWHWSLTGGNAYDNRGDASSASVNLGTLPASSTPYTFMVYTDCSDTVNGLTSSAVSQQFYVDCPAPTNLQASNITDNGFTISWTASVACQVTVNGTDSVYVIEAGEPMTQQITGLNPETQYTAIVKAKCGNEYVEQSSINVTTARLYAPTGLTVTTGWNGSAGDNGGSATIEWTTIEGLTYEVNTDNNTQTSPY